MSRGVRDRRIGQPTDVHHSERDNRLISVHTDTCLNREIRKSVVVRIGFPKQAAEKKRVELINKDYREIFSTQTLMRWYRTLQTRLDHLK